MRKLLGRIGTDGKWRTGAEVEAQESVAPAVQVGSDGRLVSNSIPLNHPDAPRVDRYGRACFASKREQDEFKARTGYATMESGVAMDAVSAAKAEKREKQAVIRSREREAEFIARRRG